LISFLDGKPLLIIIPQDNIAIGQEFMFFGEKPVSPQPLLKDQFIIPRRIKVRNPTNQLIAPVLIKTPGLLILGLG
jgi:hypothetical protein